MTGPSLYIPQADRLQTVRKVLQAVSEQPASAAQLEELVHLSYRQVGYALDALAVLGFAYRADDGSWSITEQGHQINLTRLESIEEKDLFRSSIRETEFGKVTAELWKRPPVFLPRESLAKRIRDRFGLAATTSSRRASTLVSWARYLSSATVQTSLPLPDSKMYESGFDTTTFPAAVKKLFQLNSYEVVSPYMVRGSEVDMQACSKTEPFAAPIYIEATIQRVDTAKYGKDLTKLVQVQRDQPNCKCLIVSASGFTDDVRERAPGAGVETYTWPELRAKFEQFDSYLNAIVARLELQDLDRVYEEPDLDDEHGMDSATAWCTALAQATEIHRWIIISGEYGTGKTALTKILEYRWARAHLQNPSLPIPFRIELRSFSHQFNARSLVFHFLDTNGLTHLSLDYVFSLIHSGRIVLLLDGYDEMAQHMHLRERRACLEALASISAQGARGIITSRPNYFSENEELQLFELLYRDVEFASPLVRHSYEQMATKERQIDQLLENHFLERKERSLRDLTPDQTRALVERVLVNDPDGQRVVLRMLENVFRASVSAGRYSLGGKPVIVTYLLEIIDALKVDDLSDGAERVLTEWSIYSLIVEKLMIRDFQQRTTHIVPVRRREFLELLAARMSQANEGGITESQFRDLIRDFFKRDMAKYFADGREAEVERHFADLRSSSTLTVLDNGVSRVWRFSHNSLREFLSCNRLILRMEGGKSPDVDHPVTDAMKAFVASKSRDEILLLAAQLVKCRRANESDGSIGRYVELLYSAAYRIVLEQKNPAGVALELLTGSQPDISGLTISRMEFARASSGAVLSGCRATGAVLAECSFQDARLDGSTFDMAILESVSFRGANLSESSFRGAALLDVDFSGADLDGACFEGVSPDDVQITYEGKGASWYGEALRGMMALGFLASRGGKVDAAVDLRWSLMHDDKFQIFEKICRKLIEQGQRQRRGLEQRGAAQRNQVFGKDAVAFLLRTGLIEQTKIRGDELVSPTAPGRDVLLQFVEGQTMPSSIQDYLVKVIRGG